jgi:hypothetical protein
MLQTLGDMSILKNNNNALIALQCCVIVYLLQWDHLCNGLMHGHKKNKSANILCPCSSIVCNNILCPHSSIMCVIGGNKQGKKNEEKGKGKETKVNLILCYVCPMIPMGPYAFRHNHCTLSFFFWINVNKGPIQRFKFVLGILNLGPSSKVTISLHSIPNSKDLPN